MDKFLKIQSVQGGEITNSDNLRDFNIPAGDVYDLRDSFVQFNCEIDVTEDTPAGGTGVYNNMVQWVTTDTSKPHFQNVAFVKNASLRSDSKGIIESIRRVDILKQNLAVLAKSQREEADESYLQVNQLIQPINAQQYGIFGSFNKTGAVKSISNRNTPLAVKLSDIYDFCSTDEYDTTRGGGLRLHMELNRDKLEAVQNMLTAEVQPQPEILRFMDLVGAGVTGNTIKVGTGTTQLRVMDLDQSPYYVGQKLLISAVGQGTAPNKPADVTDAPVVISAITWTRGNADQTKGGLITLEFESDWGVTLAGDGGYNTITAKIATCTPTLKINDAELVLKKKNKGDMRNYDQIQYTTYTTEEGFGNSRTDFQDLFTIEGDATQAIMMFAQGNDGLVSSAPLTSFRCALNNIPITDRDVEVPKPLYYDRLASNLRGQGYNLRNLVQNGGASQQNVYADVYTNAETQVLPLVASLFQTAQNKFLQVNCNVGTQGGLTGVNNYQLYKAIPKVFAY
tara:strand:- start:1759 stop:3285 length:1527 start_codon:yes stop_codon:yes gene_type:complete